MAFEFYFNLKTAKIFQAVRWERHPIFRFARIKKRLFLVLFFITFLAFLYGFLTENFSQNWNQTIIVHKLITGIIKGADYLHCS